MDWKTILTLIIGALIGLGPAAVQWWKHDSSERTRWVRDRRLEVYANFIEAFDVHLDALHFGLSMVPEWEVPPDPLPSVGNTRQAFEKSLSQLSIFGPASVTELGHQLKFVTWHINNTVGVEVGGDAYYSYWLNANALRNSFVAACRIALNVDTKDTPAELSYQEWVTEWTKKPAKTQ